jgi:cell division protein FtsB
MQNKNKQIQELKAENEKLKAEQRKTLNEIEKLIIKSPEDEHDAITLYNIKKLIQSKRDEK